VTGTVVAAANQTPLEGAQIAITGTTAVRYWDAGQASARFGMGHPRGVIALTRR
jgi:hypothetical protein